MVMSCAWRGWCNLSNIPGSHPHLPPWGWFCRGKKGQRRTQGGGMDGQSKEGREGQLEILRVHSNRINVFTHLLQSLWMEPLNCTTQPSGPHMGWCANLVRLHSTSHQLVTHSLTLSYECREKRRALQNRRQYTIHNTPTSVHTATYLSLLR